MTEHTVETPAIPARRAIELWFDFGAPTLFVGGEMFWGDDRLDDALAHCARAEP